ncbi:MAG: isoleucine--tRNA ligase [Planctomycetota bacterium]|nr:MAG: isoleucine--tRNA ligase [Planctomycetota bacterium]
MSDKKNKGYRDTLNLPKTSFSMKANLVQREPQLRKEWAKMDIYTKIRKARNGSPLYILHDGPPYANGDIHMGHVINKVLKDFVVKYKTMRGFDAPFVPGWDCHGLPIESKVVGELGNKMRGKSRLAIRKDCYKYASKYVKVQSKQFQELGIFGDFDNPYLTFKPQYEAGILEVFAELVDKGLVNKQLKPIHWSVGCETALAEAELEYKDVSSPSTFVNFPVAKESIGRLTELGLVKEDEAKDAKICFMIWTTTPWTLAANLAIAVHPVLDYVAVRYNKDGRSVVSIVGANRLGAVTAAAGLSEGNFSVSNVKVYGNQLEGLRYKHPFVEKNPTDKDAYMVVCAQYVTTEDGTGVVHIAPGHGVEDYITGQDYELATYSPVKNDGCYDDTVPDWLRGKNVLEVDTEVNTYLRDNGFLVAEEKMLHSYPHCWRSKMPVIFRATEQWFIRVDKDFASPKPGQGGWKPGYTLRNLALKAIKNVRWIPGWGQKRIEGMLESRPDWCISRQRSWGLPIPAFINSNGQSFMTKESVLAVAKYIGEHGSDSWFTDSPRQILGEDFELPQGFDFDDLQKEENIFDVWFESGCSWYSVCVKQTDWPVPVDLYLEGSDQHRGWFQLSLLSALGKIEKEPFKNVLTHGFTVDEKGMKQSKSLGNYVNAQEEVAKYGSDILRLWVASVNYQEDIRCNDGLIGRTQDAYRKIRNTLRYLLGNTADFNPNEQAVTYDDMLEIDKWAMQQLQKLITNIIQTYENFIFHRVFSLIYNFCTVEMSSIYMDVLKDRMYCELAGSLSRRSGQTAMHRILDSLVRLLAPILVHTAEEAWEMMPFKAQAFDSVHLADMPEVDDSIDWRSEEGKWAKIMNLRDEVLRVLEDLRRDKKIASNQEAAVLIYSDDDELISVVNDFGIEAFAALCIVSEVRLQNYPDDMRKENEETKKLTGIDVIPPLCVAIKSKNKKCQRCWNYWPSVGGNSEYPDLCKRCVEVVRGLNN